MTLVLLKQQLQALASEPARLRMQSFFKTGPGQYAEHDRFMGVTVPQLRSLVKAHQAITRVELSALMDSPFNEERLLALLFAIRDYQKQPSQKENLHQWYLKHLPQVNNWNLVDASAHYLLGAHLTPKNSTFLDELIQSEVMWFRRIAVVATWHFIRNHEFEPTFDMVQQVLNDPEDLMHKASGWMLREVGKKNESALVFFLKKHVQEMPSTMRRYAVERLPSWKERIGYER